MVKYNTAAAVLLFLSSVDGFGPRLSATSLVQRASVSTLQRHVSSPSLYDPLYDDNNENSIRAALGNLSASYVDSLSEAAADDEDPYEEEQARKELKKKIIRERSGNYEVTLPIVHAAGLGVSLCEVNSGEFSDSDLNLDTLRLQAPPGECTDSADAVAAGSLGTIDQSVMAKRLGPNFRGVIVSSVVQNGKGWNKGIRPGHVLVATSATLGEALWPKSTLEGVRSAIFSRKNLLKSMTFEFQRVDTAEIAEQYELTLPRPIGLQLEESEDGYVQVSGFTENAPRLIKYAVKVGDRVLAVDSLAGSMWPVSTVDGVISACTSRLPGRTVTLRFARPYANEAIRNKQTETSAEAMASGGVVGAAQIGVSRSLSKVAENPATETLTRTAANPTQDELMARCRDVIRRYMADVDTKFKDKYAVPAIVADRVLEALASASAKLDAETLSLIMSAYLSCRKPESAIRVFEAVVGLSGDGSSVPVTTTIEGKEKGGIGILPNTAALNLYTGTCILRAHALAGDIQSVRRVLYALEGRSGVTVDGTEVAQWPGTGVSGSIVPDTTCYNTALGAAAKNGRIDMALELFDNMTDPMALGGKPGKDVVSYNTMIGALVKAGRWRDAFVVFDRMNLAKVKPDKFTYTSLIKACVNEGDIQELLFDMKERGVEPDVVTYNTMIKALCQRKKWYEAKKFITEMEQRGILPNSMTYGLLMNALLKANKPAACLTLFETACFDERSTALTENVHLYTTAIAATSAMENYERGLELVSRMNASGVKPNIKTLTALMGSCLSSGKPDMATDVYRKIDNPDGYARTMAIRAFCASGDLVSASEILSEQRNGRRDMSGKEVMQSYNTLISSSLEQHDHAMARRTLTELLRSNYIPSKVTFQSIVEALNLGPKKSIMQEPPVDEAFDFLLFVLDSLRTRNLPCDGSFYASTLFCGARLGGLRRKIASYLSEARSLTESTGKMTTMINDQRQDRFLSSWKDLIANYDEYKDDIGNEMQLPPLVVRVGNRNIRQVLSAERAVQYRYNAARATRRPEVVGNNLTT